MVLNSVKRLPGQHLKGKKNLFFSIHIVTLLTVSHWVLKMMLVFTELEIFCIEEH